MMSITTRDCASPSRAKSENLNFECASGTGSDSAGRLGEPAMCNSLLTDDSCKEMEGDKKKVGGTVTDPNTTPIDNLHFKCALLADCKCDRCDLTVQLKRNTNTLYFNAAVQCRFSQTWSDMQSQLGQGLKHDIIHRRIRNGSSPSSGQAGSQERGEQQANAPKCEMDLAKTQLCVHDQRKRERIERGSLIESENEGIISSVTS